MATKVHNLATGEVVATYHTLNAEESVLAAHAQFMHHDWSSYDYAARYGALLKRDGRYVSCGAYYALAEGV